MNKTLYCIRHGKALHNELYKIYGSKTFYNEDYCDTVLTPEGEKQSLELGRTWINKKNIELVIVSPLKRTLQTAYNIFKDTNIPIVVLDFTREFPLGLHTCNKRSNLEELKILYPSFDFSNIKENKDIYWNKEREETIGELNLRIGELYMYIKNIPQKKIAFVNHSSFIGKMKDNHIKYLDNGEEELKHCYPYEMNINF
jgi:broad specificity phosphatase PhoE